MQLNILLKEEIKIAKLHQEYSPWREKFKQLRKIILILLFFLKFNNSLRTMPPEDFISEILDSINLKSFTVGDDFRFGAR
jgi:FAD synthase